eukprot:CAMPEP_0172869624 /NCGR_PEP_ID=MMETSP1075-20121228/89544_1 /TAXON_ID=2916 /ORGANISM="Ceratium fusus, Strain PA161109" /LENGTH=272 /DNA_ID=CAMNT_0013719569 /DNA_START=44 /DNA_END=862 /DNA_ORIENTATION=+
MPEFPTCQVCNGSGLLLSEVCPLCDGDPSFSYDIQDKGCNPVPIFILAGQSNCVGRGVPEDVSSDLAERIAQRVRICFDLERHRPEEAHTASWESLTPGCQVNPQFGEHFGPEISLADTLLLSMANTAELCFAKFAMGSSSLVIGRDGGDPEWDPDGGHVNALIKFLQEQCALLGRPAYFAGMFWNQGNSDLKVKQSDGSADKYTDRLVTLLTRVRSELKHLHRGLPFVACHVRKGSKPKTTQQINAAIAKAWEQLDQAMCIPIPDGATLAR